MTQVDILVAEDFAPFREFASRELQRRPEFRVVAVSDGLAAVESAKELQPHFVVLDIGLPLLNGLAAARRIRSLSPASKIVFLTEEPSLDVVDEALGLGSLAYIQKRSAHYLLSTVEALLDGPSIGASTLADGRRPVPQEHRVQFYSDDTTLLDASARFLTSALNAHDAVIAIATRSHLQRLLPRLSRSNSNVERAVAQGSFVHLDADELVARIRSDEVGSWQPTFVRTIESAAAATMRPGPRVAMFSECASILWAAGHTDAAIELEQGPLEIANAASVDVLCTYPLLPADGNRRFKTVCAQHGAIAIR